jgi:hypothetical protein
MELHTLVARVRAEFNEMPGLRLTAEQAQRLWGVEPAICESVIDALVRTSFLRRAQGGTIMRAA